MPNRNSAVDDYGNRVVPNYGRRQERTALRAKYPTPALRILPRSRRGLYPDAQQAVLPSAPESAGSVINREEVLVERAAAPFETLAKRQLERARHAHNRAMSARTAAERYRWHSGAQELVKDSRHEEMRADAVRLGPASERRRWNRILADRVRSRLEAGGDWVSLDGCGGGLIHEREIVAVDWGAEGTWDSRQIWNTG